MKEKSFEEPKSYSHVQLSPRQIQVLRLMCNDKTNAEIAETLNVSIRTVETFKTQILRSAGAKNMASVVKWAVQEGLI